MTVLAIETSCDETSVALVREGTVLSNVVSSQIRLHAPYGGVVPELAAREHLSQLLPAARLALEEARVAPWQLDAVAATLGPGLPNALLIGCQAAQAAAHALQRPFLGIHHHEAHLYSPWIQGRPARADFATIEPHVSLIVSGGHTLLVEMQRALAHRVLGGTVDDAAGECFDKTAKLLGLPYPGGPVVDRLAAEGNPAAVDFPRPMLKDSTDDFSFSGLKTAVRYHLRDHPLAPNDRPRLCDVCASVQAAIVEVLVTKTVRAARRVGVRCVTASGGVTCNRGLRQELTSACQRQGWTLRLAEPALCTDNAAMIGILAEYKLSQGTPPMSLNAEPKPGWELGET